MHNVMPKLFRFREIDPEHSTCRRGRWQFQAPLHPVSLEDFKQDMNEPFNMERLYNPTPHMWARADDGVVIARGGSWPQEGGSFRFWYHGSDFIINYKLHGVPVEADFDREDFIKYPKSRYRQCIWVDIDHSFVTTLTQAERLQFETDVTDPNLYKCLLECVPAHWIENRRWAPEILIFPLAELVFQEYSLERLAKITEKSPRIQE